LFAVLVRCNREISENTFKMFNFTCYVIILLLGLISVDAMSIKRSEKSANNMEKVDDTEYPMKVNYDVYPVSQKCRFRATPRLLKDLFVFGTRTRTFLLCNRSKAFAMRRNQPETQKS
jgi:hypothetical protein